MNEHEQFTQTIANNIRATVRKMRRDQCLGASVRCLAANTPTPRTGPDLTPEQYAELFGAIARQTVPDFLTD